MPSEHVQVTHTLKIYTHEADIMWFEYGLYTYLSTVKPVTRGHLNKCPYMTGVPSSQVHFNVKVHFGSQEMQFRHPDRCPLVTGFTVHPKMYGSLELFFVQFM